LSQHPVGGTAMRVLVVGLDGATFDLIRPWAEEGHLPTMARLLREGAHGELRSTLPPVTSPAWPSFMTGMNPGTHGVFDFLRRTPGGFEMVNSSHAAGRTLWQILSEAGRRVGVIAVPTTYPPSPVNGFMITCILSPAKAEITYPPGLLRRYEPELGRYRIGPDVSYREGNQAEYAADLIAMMQQRAKYALRLMRDHEWDFLMVHFLALDLAQHAFWKLVDPAHPLHNAAALQNHGNLLLKVYQKADAILGQLWAHLADEDMLLVMSDHGFGPLHGTVNLNNVLMRHGFLHLKRDAVTRLRYALFRRGLTPRGVYRLLVRLHMQNVIARFGKSARNAALDQFLPFSAVDWTRTTAYSLGHVGQVFINLAGRDPQGIVPPAAYEAERERVADALRQLRHPVTDTPLVDEIVLREQAYHGPYADRGADLLPVMDGGRYIAFPLFASDAALITPQLRGDSGCHRLQGILMAAGPHVRRAEQLTGAEIIDLAPTILYVLGVPVPDNMDGHVLTAMLEPESLLSHPHEGLEAKPAARTTEYHWQPEEEAEIEARLRGMGYLS